jgi:DNA-directed RNA polymerase specialized sigma24 family protein
VALLAAYGEALYDFITLMLGPGGLAERVLTDTTIAAISLIGKLRDEEMLPAWFFALARHECRRHPPVVWRERQWKGLCSLAMDGRVVPGAALPVEVVRMALLGLAPRDREVLVLASTRCKLLSCDLARILRISLEDAVRSAAEAQENFEQALAVCARAIGYRRDLRNRPPEISELVGMVLSGIQRPLPSGRILHASKAPELAAYRREVAFRIHLNEFDGFPEQPGSVRQRFTAPSYGERRAPEVSRPGMAVAVSGHAEERTAGARFTRQTPFEPVSPGPGTRWATALRTPPLDRPRQARHEWTHPADVVTG